MNQRVATITALLTVAVLTAGCSSSDRPRTAASSPHVSAPAPSPTEPFNGDGAAEIWRKADLGAARATSFHIVMKGFFQKEPVSMDMSLSSGPKAVGKITLNGHALNIRRIRKDIWFQAGRGFWRDRGITGRSADRLVGRWVKGSQSNTSLDIVFDLTNMSFIRKNYVSELGTSVLYTHVGDGEKIDGHQTVGLSARARALEGGEYKVTINIASDGTPLPMRCLVTSAKKYRGASFLYTQWSKKVTVVRPGNALRIPPGPA